MKTNIFSILAAIALMAVATACTIDTRGTDDSTYVPPVVDDTDDDTDDDTTPDAGTPADDTDVDDGNLADVYDIEFTAPLGATEVIMDSNVWGDWNEQVRRVAGRTITWTGRLDYEKLDRPACLEGASSQCGYLVSFDFDVAPFHGCVRDPAGNFREVSQPHVNGPNRVEFVPVDNGRNGCHFHLRLVRAEPR